MWHAFNPRFTSEKKNYRDGHDTLVDPRGPGFRPEGVMTIDHCSRSTRHDAGLALPRAMTEKGRRRLLFSIGQSYDRLPPETCDLPLRGLKRQVLQLLDTSDW